MTLHSVGDLITELRRRQSIMRRGFALAEVATIRQAKAHALMLSSGPLTPAQTKGIYARRNPRARFPAVINVQTGDFRASWFTSEYNGDGSRGRFTNSLINNSSVADFMKGTRFMIERPIIDRVGDLIEPMRVKRLQAVLDKVMNS
jgi:hypothetical protein